MRSRFWLFKLEIKQGRYFYSPTILLKLIYWHMLSPYLILLVKTLSYLSRLTKSANKPLSGMLSVTAIVPLKSGAKLCRLSLMHNCYLCLKGSLELLCNSATMTCPTRDFTKTKKKSLLCNIKIICITTSSEMSYHNLCDPGSTVLTLECFQGDVPEVNTRL